MSIERKNIITIGSRVRITKDVKMLSIIYKKGHEFTVTSIDGIRGLDLVDDKGNVLAETRFIDRFIELVEP